MILVALAIGWAPLFIAELVRQARPDLDAAYRPQAFGMAWMFVTVVCSLLALLLAAVHAVR